MTIFNYLSSFIKRMRFGISGDSVHDWLVLLALSTIALISIIVWNVWAFDTVASGGALGTPHTRAPEVFNKSSLETIRTIFENRAVEEVKYESGVYRFTDPSQ